jgi:hypothetical protein
VLSRSFLEKQILLPRVQHGAVVLPILVSETGPKLPYTFTNPADFPALPRAAYPGSPTLLVLSHTRGEIIFWYRNRYSISSTSVPIWQVLSSSPWSLLYLVLLSSSSFLRLPHLLHFKRLLLQHGQRRIPSRSACPTSGRLIRRHRRTG